MGSILGKRDEILHRSDELNFMFILLLAMSTHILYNMETLGYYFLYMKNEKGKLTTYTLRAGSILLV